MLNLNLGSGSESWGAGQTWKVLVYDKFCQEVVAPLLKVGGLRNHGVTLHLNLASERLPVADVPAVYFVEPTEANIKRIVEDLAKGLYESCYINFASAVPRSLLQELARGALQANAAQKVAGVFDRYVSFVSLSSSLFSLNLPAAYETIHSPSITDELIQQYVERIVDGLLSVLVTLKVLPVIRCPPHEAAAMVARRLEDRIRELLAKGGAIATDLFSSAAGAARPGGEPAGSRPLLVLLDRDVDLATMLNHTWTYQAMVHDVLGMRLNRLTVPVDSAGDESAPPKPKSYDVDEGDGFWAAHAGEPFPAVAEAVHSAIQEFERKRADMSKAGPEPDSSMGIAPDLAAAINALPEMTEKKRSIDMHTNIATALLNEVKARSLDRYYEIEDQFSSQSLGTSVAQLEQLLNDRQKGTAVDKTRALMVLCLTKPGITEAQLQGLRDALQAAGGDVSGLLFLDHLSKMRNMMTPGLSAGPGGGSSSTSASSSLMAGALGGLADRVLAKGEGLLAAGMSGIKNILPSKKELPVCQILDALVDQKPGGPAESYLYLDPKAPAGAEVPRIRAPFRRALTFVVGGGNYAELQALQEWAQAKGRQVTYGATDLVSPSQFAEELCHLGQAFGQSHSSSADDLR